MNIEKYINYGDCESCILRKYNYIEDSHSMTHML